MSTSVRVLLSKLRGDKFIWLIVFVLSLFSILAVYSSTGTLAFKYRSGNTEYYLLRHGSLLLFGLVLMYFASLPNYKFYSRLAQVMMVISIPLLLYTLIAGARINEAARWITLPGIDVTFQTSDLAKLALIMFTARQLARKQHVMRRFREGVLPTVVPIVLTCLLIAPADLSTAALLFLTCFTLMFIGRMGMRYLAGLMGTATGAALLLGLFIYVMPPNALPGRMGTWKARIETFRSGDAGESYQTEQSKIAIAEGGLLGRGPGASHQRNYLPHPYSDFIYAIIVEEYGILGGGLVVLLYLAFFFRCLRIVSRSPSPFGALLAVGLGLALTMQAFVNMAVTVDILPVTGLTLPLVSMGGTSLWFTSIAIGIILAVSRDLGMDAQTEFADALEEGEGIGQALLKDLGNTPKTKPA
jgi:cell division protein FtsW